ncbi:MAG: hypothetical protein ACI8RZ_002261 [Myxococcota bacterium]|jgi:hypothetical protein
MQKLLPLPLTVLALGIGTAQAAWPDDITLSQLGTWKGESYDQTDTIQQAYARVIQQTGMAVANTPLGAAETLGINGFDVAMTSSVSFLESNAGSPWQRVHTEADPSRAMWIPGVTVRKGLPMSLEAGAQLGYIAFSRQTRFGGWGRVGLVEGYKKLPDVTLQVGYAGYVGNPELALGVMDTSLVIGKTWAFGRMMGINTASASPYLGVGMYRIRATPRLDESTLEEWGISEVSGFSKSDAFAEGYNPIGIHLGTRILSGDFQILMGSTISPSAGLSLSAGLGYAY